MGHRPRSTTASTVGRVAVSGVIWRKRWRGLALLAHVRRLTAPTSKRTARRMAAKGGEKSGDWTITGRSNDKTPHPDRRDRAPLRLQPDRRQRRRQHGCASFAPRIARRKLCAWRQGLRCRCTTRVTACRKNHPGNSRPQKPKAQDSLR